MTLRPGQTEGAQAAKEEWAQARRIIPLLLFALTLASVSLQAGIKNAVEDSDAYSIAKGMWDYGPLTFGLVAVVVFIYLMIVAARALHIESIPLPPGWGGGIIVTVLLTVFLSVPYAAAAVGIKSAKEITYELNHYYCPHRSTPDATNIPGFGRVRLAPPPPRGCHHALTDHTLFSRLPLSPFAGLIDVIRVFLAHYGVFGLISGALIAYLNVSAVRALLLRHGLLQPAAAVGAQSPPPHNDDATAGGHSTPIRPADNCSTAPPPHAGTRRADGWSAQPPPDSRARRAEHTATAAEPPWTAADDPVLGRSVSDTEQLMFLRCPHCGHTHAILRGIEIAECPVCKQRYLTGEAERVM